MSSLQVECFSHWCPVCSRCLTAAIAGVYMDKMSLLCRASTTCIISNSIFDFLSAFKHCMIVFITKNRQKCIIFSTLNSNLIFYALLFRNGDRYSAEHIKEIFSPHEKHKSACEGKLILSAPKRSHRSHNTRRCLMCKLTIINRDDYGSLFLNIWHVPNQMKCFL